MTAGKPTGRLFFQHDQWRVFLHNVRRQLRRFVRADVLRDVRGACGDVQGIASLERYRRLTLELIFKRAFNDVGHFHPGMGMLGGHHTRLEINEDLDHLTPGDVEILAQQIGAVKARLPAFYRRRLLQLERGPRRR